MNAGPFKVDQVAVPAVSDAEFYSQVRRQIVRCMLRFFVAEFMVGMDIDFRQDVFRIAPARSV